MTRDPHDVAKVYSGPLELVEVFLGILGEAGIAGNVVGTNLAASFGSLLPGSTELWVHREDLAKAEVIIAEAAKDHEHKPEAKHDREPPHFPHPTDSAKPGTAPARHEPWINPDPRS